MFFLGPGGGDITDIMILPGCCGGIAGEGRIEIRATVAHCHFILAGVGMRPDYSSGAGFGVCRWVVL